MLLLQFDLEVDLYTPQPLTIKYQGTDGRFHRYTPDGLVEWRKDLEVSDRRPLLVEVKHRVDFSGSWRDWRVRARAAQRCAEEKGWRFEIVTEGAIRTPFLENVRFLLPYKRQRGTAEVDLWILDKLNELGEATPQKLIGSLYLDRWNQAELIPVVWRLLAERSIGCDLTLPLTMQSPLWTLRG